MCVQGVHRCNSAGRLKTFAETESEADRADVEYGGRVSRLGNKCDVEVWPGGGEGLDKSMSVEEFYRVF